MLEYIQNNILVDVYHQLNDATEFNGFIVKYRKNGETYYGEIFLDDNGESYLFDEYRKETFKIHVKGLNHISIDVLRSLNIRFYYSFEEERIGFLDEDNVTLHPIYDIDEILSLSKEAFDKSDEFIQLLSPYYNKVFKYDIQHFLLYQIRLRLATSTFNCKLINGTTSINNRVTGIRNTSIKIHRPIYVINTVFTFENNVYDDIQYSASKQTNVTKHERTSNSSKLADIGEKLYNYLVKMSYRSKELETIFKKIEAGCFHPQEFLEIGLID